MKAIDKVNKILDENNFKIKLSKDNLNKNIKELGVDSIAIMSVIVRIEEEFNITLDDDKLMNIKTANDLITLIDESIK